RGNDTRRYRVDANPVADHFLRPAMGDRRDEAFGAGVDDRASTPTMTRCDRADVDDIAALLPAHDRDYFTHEHRHLDHVEREHLVHVFLGVVVDPGTAHHATGVVDQHVDPAIRFQRGGNDPL